MVLRPLLVGGTAPAEFLGTLSFLVTEGAEPICGSAKIRSLHVVVRASKTQLPLTPPFRILILNI
ncbi:hypothetical protein BS47DRAFT_113439 [Hydnum rufescens UP504]|uniref:Uncharacterized protein n=1 Tax=Hydnum rufescens UP504 TaxID=1448309 RepID=A0A9P6DSV5_9AGAM|nr:hypothetical protein BS47DRAFT_113439 [Hydnum rufescens UP504]